MLKYYRLILVGCLVWTTQVLALLELEIKQSADNAMALTILTPNGSSSAHDLGAIISADLTNSGRFKTVSAWTEDITEQNAALWQARKIEAVLKVVVVAEGAGSLAVQYELFDVYGKRVLFQNRQTVNSSQLRRLAHHISDLVYQQLTGDRGIFSTKIAYVIVSERRARHARYQLQIADSDGYNAQTLVTSRFPLMSPAWSPDGKKLAYVSFEGHRSAIYVQNVSTGSRTVVSKFPGINGAPAWSPDGSKLALVLTRSKTDNPKIYTLNLGTNHVEQLTFGWSLDTEPSWAPDGESLIFTSDRGGSPQIYRVNLGNKALERVTYKGSYNATAKFIPAGNMIVMLHKEMDMFSIAKQDLATGRVTSLTPYGVNSSPSIAPNGKMIVYATNHGGRGMLAAVSLDGKVRLLLPAGFGIVQEPAWSPFV